MLMGKQHQQPFNRALVYEGGPFIHVAFNGKYSETKERGRGREYGDVEGKKAKSRARQSIGL